ncbi:MAG: lytic transglycosylase domain-containing protein [Clostridia bacterium]|nr:lytic transglycosylase domain-containing protein [Clostridia bacterium]
MKKIIFVVVGVLLFSFSTLIFVKVVYPIKYREAVSESSTKYEIEESLIYAVIKAESGFSSKSVSKSGAYGLMQILPSTMCYIMNEEIEKERLFEPEFNIEVGTKYLRYLLNKFNDIRVVLSAYNAGEGNVFVWLKDKNYSLDGKTLKTTPFKETNNYVEKVLKYEKIYKKLLKN